MDAIIEGTVLRSRDHVRITAQLIQASIDKHLWAESYEGDVRNTLSLQKQVASAIADQLRVFKHIVSMQTDVPVELPKTAAPNWAAAATELARLGAKNLSERIAARATSA